MHPNCFYDTFFRSHKALDKYNICAKNQYPPTLHRKVRQWGANDVDGVVFDWSFYCRL